MTAEHTDDHRGWSDHQQMQVRARLATTPAQRLEWLERAIAFARAAGALPRHRRPNGRN